jgi:hypothetical protein
MNPLLDRISEFVFVAGFEQFAMFGGAIESHPIEKVPKSFVGTLNMERSPVPVFAKEDLGRNGVEQGVQVFGNVQMHWGLIGNSIAYHEVCE